MDYQEEIIINETACFAGNRNHLPGHLAIVMVFQSSLELVDFFWVGMLGTEALAALSLSNNIFWMLFTLSQLITVSTLSMISRYRGSGDLAGLQLVARHTF